MQSKEQIMKRHPLEDAFNMGTDEGYQLGVEINVPDGEDEYLAVQQSDLPPPPAIPDDAEDKEINSKIDEIFGQAMQAYQSQTTFVEILEPRYAARNAEVANNYLNTALNAVALKARVKNEKRKTNAAFVPYKHGGAGNVVVADRNEILRMMAAGQGPIIDSGNK